ncbi:MAG: MFS transporter [Bdellovibrionota bacterium]
MLNLSNPFMIPETELKRLRSWRLSTFWVALIGYMGYYLCRANLSAAFPLISKEFGYTNEQLAWIAVSSEIAYAVGKIINGPIADRIGGKKIFLLGMIGAVACNIAFAQGSTLIYFIVVWCLCRFFLSMGWGGLTKMIGNWYEPERNGTIMGWISLNFQFGAVLATLLAGFIVVRGGRWQDVFIYPAILLAVIAIYSALASKEAPNAVVPGTRFGKSPVGREAIAKTSISHDNHRSKTFKILMGLLKLPLYRHVLFFAFLTTFLRSIFFFWTPKLLVDIGLGTAEGIFKSALFPFLGCLGTVLLGWYTDRHAKNGDRARMMWIMLAGLSVCLFALATLIGAKGAQNLPYTAIVILISLSGFFLLGPYSMSAGALTLDIAGGEAAGTSTGLVDGVGYIGGALSVWLAGKISDELGWGQVCQLLGVVAILSTLSAYLMSREFQRRARLEI